MSKSGAFTEPTTFQSSPSLRRDSTSKTSTGGPQTATAPGIPATSRTQAWWSHIAFR